MLSEPDSFAELIDRLRRGDNDAARAILARYEPALKRIIGMRLMDRKLRGLVETDDICQSVFGSFFVRLGLGQYELDSESDLLRLLATMVRNKVVSKQRRRALEDRDDVRSLINERQNRAGSQETPSECVVFEDLVKAAERLIAPGDRELIALRKQGMGWNAIATKLGDDPERLRKRLARTVDFVIEQLGLDDVA